MTLNEILGDYNYEKPKRILLLVLRSVACTDTYESSLMTSDVVHS
jgi:hypothetical protein